MLGAIDARIEPPPQSLEIQREFLAKAGRPFGHLLIERKTGFLATTSESTVRLVAAPQAEPTSAVAAGTGDGTPPAAATLPLVDVILAASTRQLAGWNHIISWQRPPSSGYPLFPVFEVPKHKPADLENVLAGLNLDVTRALLKDRIVFIGGAMDDRDRHNTPLTVMSGEPMWGVFIHAQALAQRLDGNRDIIEWGWWPTFTLVSAVAFACFVAAHLTGLNPRGFAYGTGGLIVIGALSFAAFKYLRIDIPSIALMTAWLGGGFAGFVSRAIFRSGKLDF